VLPSRSSTSTSIPKAGITASQAMHVRPLPRPPNHVFTKLVAPGSAPDLILARIISARGPTARSPFFRDSDVDVLSVNVPGRRLASRPVRVTHVRANTVGSARPAGKIAGATRCTGHASPRDWCNVCALMICLWLEVASAQRLTGCE
jgi:hypothetical protein